jgi:hypothetical protein
MIITKEDIIIANYLFLIVSGLITLFGGLIVYFTRKPKRKR